MRRHDARSGSLRLNKTTVAGPGKIGAAFSPVREPTPAMNPTRNPSHPSSAQTAAQTSAQPSAQTPSLQPAPAPSRANLPPQPISAEVLIEKYAKGDEDSIAAVRLRVARALAAVEPSDKRAHWEARFQHAQNRGFVPAGRNARLGRRAPTESQWKDRSETQDRREKGEVGKGKHLCDHLRAAEGRIHR